MSHYYAKFKENPFVGTDASTPFSFLKLPEVHDYAEMRDNVMMSLQNNNDVKVTYHSRSYSPIQENAAVCSCYMSDY